jgi:hypothetical protein
MDVRFAILTPRLRFLAGRLAHLVSCHCFCVRTVAQHEKDVGLPWFQLFFRRGVVCDFHLLRVWQYLCSSPWVLIAWCATVAERWQIVLTAALIALIVFPLIAQHSIIILGSLAYLNLTTRIIQGKQPGID